MQKHMARWLGFVSLLAALLSLQSCVTTRADGSHQASAPANWKLPTMGGTQFWTDVHHHSGWRIQRHFASGHFRLLNPNDFREAWGTRQNCQDKLDGLTDSIPANKGTVLILAHGLGRTSGCWKPMANLAQEQTDWQTIPFTYASTRESIESQSESLAQFIQSLGPNVQTIHFAGHSWGNIVVRHFLASASPSARSRIGRFVMMGSPNQGSRMARILYPTLVFPLFAGSSIEAMGRGWNDLSRTLGTPPCEFGIIAGGHRDNRQGWNPLLNGSSDGAVSLSEAMLPGATDLLIKPLLHTTMMKDLDVCKATLRFLESGHFVAR